MITRLETLSLDFRTDQKSTYLHRAWLALSYEEKHSITLIATEDGSVKTCSYVVYYIYNAKRHFSAHIIITNFVTNLRNLEADFNSIMS